MAVSTIQAFWRSLVNFILSILLIFFHVLFMLTYTHLWHFIILLVSVVARWSSCINASFLKHLECFHRLLLSNEFLLLFLNEAESYIFMRLSFKLTLIRNHVLWNVGMEHLLYFVLALPKLFCIFLKLGLEFFIQLFVVWCCLKRRGIHFVSGFPLLLRREVDKRVSNRRLLIRLNVDFNIRNIGSNGVQTFETKSTLCSACSSCVRYIHTLRLLLFESTWIFERPLLIKLWWSVVKESLVLTAFGSHRTTLSVKSESRILFLSCYHFVLVETKMGWAL